MILLLDLVLLKPRVFLHLLFNRGTPPLDALAPDSVQVDSGIDSGRHDRLRADVIWLAMLVIGAETMVRLIPYSKVAELDALFVARTLVTVLAETIAQHAVTLVLTLLALHSRGWYPVERSQKKLTTHADGRRANFTWVPTVPWSGQAADVQTPARAAHAAVHNTPAASLATLPDNLVRARGAIS